MADTEIAAKLTLDGADANKTVKSFKQELKEAKEESLRLADTFGETSKEALNAAKNVALLKDKMADAKETADLFDPGAKFQALGNVVRTVSGGFSALTGALTLVGIGGKDAEQALLKVQAALALTEGVNTIADSAKDFQRLNALIQQSAAFQKINAAATSLASGAMKLFGVSVSQTSTAFNVLKGAIVATGIGALVVILGIVIEKLMSMKSASEEAAEAQERLKKETERLNDVLQEQSGMSDKLNKATIAQAKARGASIEEVTKLERKSIEDRIYLAETFLGDAKRKGADETALLQKLNDEKLNLRLFDYAQQEKLLGKQKEDQKKAAEAEKQAQEKRKQALKELLEREKSAADELRKLQDQNFLDSIKDEDQRNKQKIILEANREMERVAQLQVSAETRTAIIKEIRLKEAFDLESLEMEIDTEKKKAEAERLQAHLTMMDGIFANYQANRKKDAEEQKAIDEAVYANKVALAQATGDVLGGLSELFGKSTAAGKVAALAQIAVNTALGFVQGLDIAQKGAKAGGPAAPFLFPIFYATQIAAVLAAVSKAKTVLAGGGSASTSSTSIGSVNTSNVQAPLTPKVETTTTKLDQESLNSINNATSRAFVLEADVSNNQELITRLNRAARLGG